LLLKIMTPPFLAPDSVLFAKVMEFDPSMTAASDPVPLRMAPEIVKAPVQ
jgi:hypothetical protein